MPYTPPEGEILPPPQAPPASPTASAPAAPTQPRPPSRDHSDWDPRAAPATYLLVAVNCAVYLWMVAHGVSAKDPSDLALLHYGANCPWYVLHGQWFRLVTATFVHVGLLHLVTNMWCLWNLGMLGEPLLGPFGMLAIYLLTGAAGNLLSMAYNGAAFHITRDPRVLFQVGAGASGAVFGIAGILIVLLSNRRLPFAWQDLQALRRRVVQFAGINLAIGLGANFLPIGIQIDNLAHIGGFLSGLALGVPLVARMTSGRSRYLRRQKLTFAAACFALSLLGVWIVNFIHI
ncbi:MAG: rhomboid family intramembrane serine protease [Acidobacteriota bacterium]|nr:rhomboid family intramembrane serine protease [Acidobacteriota bacterium]